MKWWIRRIDWFDNWFDNEWKKWDSKIVSTWIFIFLFLITNLRLIWYFSILLLCSKIHLLSIQPSNNFSIHINFYHSLHLTFHSTPLTHLILLIFIPHFITATTPSTFLPTHFKARRATSPLIFKKKISCNLRTRLISPFHVSLTLIRRRATYPETCRNLQTILSLVLSCISPPLWFSYIHICICIFIPLPRLYPFSLVPSFLSSHGGRMETKLPAIHDNLPGFFLWPSHAAIPETKVDIFI